MIYSYKYHIIKVESSAQRWAAKGRQSGYIGRSITQASNIII